MELVHIANATFSSLRINHSLENLASKTKLSGLLKSTRHCCRAIRRVRPSGRARVIALRGGGRLESGGASRDRTGDLLVANQTLSQLSYGPAWNDAPLGRFILVGLGGVAPPTSPLSGVRSN